MITMALSSTIANADEPPNIVFVMCDDLVDRLAKEGMVFTDAHSGSSVCTPTRYGLLTGRYSWRTSLQNGVVQGFADNLIEAGRPTVASFLQAQGYYTGIVGKWHLNFNYIAPDTDQPMPKKGHADLAPVGSTIPDGPVTRGFDYFHGFHHAGNMRKVIESDTVIKHEDEINMLPRITAHSHSPDCTLAG